jgi:signal transduction histidine kinase
MKRARPKLCLPWLLALCPSPAAAEAATLAARWAALTPAAAAFYAALLGGLAVLGLVTLSAGARLWAALAAVMVGFLIWGFLNEQALQGLFWVSARWDSHLMASTGQGLLACVLLIGAWAIRAAHPLGWTRPYFIAAALISGLFGLIGPALGPGAAFTMFNASLLAVGTASIIPLLAQERLGTETARPAIVFALGIWAPLALTYIVVLFLAPPNTPLLIAVNRLSLAWLIGFGGVMTIRRILALREDRARGLQEALESAERAAEPNRALFEAERRHADMRLAVRQQVARAEEASHDLKQPIASLRSHLDALTQDKPQALKSELRTAFDYLEELATRYSGGPQAATPDPKAAAPTAQEAVPVTLLMGTLDRMFRSAAEAKGLRFDVEPYAAVVQGEELVIMRILSNLVSNAIDHTEAGQIRLTATQAGDAVQLSVFNSGRVIAAERAEALFQRGETGAASQGRGLGLAIVRQFAQEHGLRLTLEPARGAGNRFVLSLPIAAQ